jgi:hypothetical protein
MAKKLSKEERAAWEKDLDVLKRAVEQCEQVLKDDDEAEADKTAAVDEESTIARVFAAKGKDVRQGTLAGVMAIRALGGRKAGQTD